MGVAQFTDGFEWKIPRKKKPDTPIGNLHIENNMRRIICRLGDTENTMKKLLKK
jgi:hypothetical protein